LAGQLQWSPADFWKSTPAELHYMHRGWLISQGIDPDKGADALTRAEYEKLKEKFPDG